MIRRSKSNEFSFSFHRNKHPTAKCNTENESTQSLSVSSVDNYNRKLDKDLSDELVRSDKSLRKLTASKRLVKTFFYINNE